MRAMLLNKIAKKEKELDCLYLELKDYIDSLTIPNKEVKDFVHSLLIYIEQPSCKRILKQFMENYWFALNVNRRFPNCPDHFAFSVCNSDNIVRVSNEKSSRLASLNSLDLSSFTNKDNEIITAITRKVYELSITKDENGIITEIKFETY
jgi:hypothetical protein